MRFVRYQTKTEAPHYGWVFEDRIGLLEGSPFGEYRRLEADIPLESVHLFAPVNPGKDHLRGTQLCGACQGTRCRGT